MAQVQWGKFFLFSSALMVAGWGIMTATTPNEEQFYNKLSPELRKKVDEVRAQRQTGPTMKDRLETAGEQDQIVWAEELGATKPFGGGGGRRV